MTKAKSLRSKSCKLHGENFQVSLEIVPLDPFSTLIVWCMFDNFTATWLSKSLWNFKGAGGTDQTCFSDPLLPQAVTSAEGIGAEMARILVQHERRPHYGDITVGWLRRACPVTGMITLLLPLLSSKIASAWRQEACSEGAESAPGRPSNRSCAEWPRWCGISHSWSLPVERAWKNAVEEGSERRQQRDQ